MALTSEEESKLKAIIAAFDGGQQVDDLPQSDMSATDKIVEVFDKKSGRSEQMSLKSAVQMGQHPWCGLVWNLDNATPKAATYVGSLELLQTLPAELGLGCYLVKNDHSRRKLDSKDHYKYATGETAKLDGSEGHYQWGWGKEWYMVIKTVGRLHYEMVSPTPIPGEYNYKIPVGSISAAGFATLERSTGKLVSYINEGTDYRGGNNDSTLDNTNRTMLGKAATNQTTEYWRAAARKNGTGWLCTTMRHTSAIAVLFGVIFGTHYDQDAVNSQKDANGLYQGGLGAGVTQMPDWGGYNGYRPVVPMSAGIELGDACGEASYEVKKDDGTVVYTAKIPSFFGYKNGYGLLWRHMDDEQVRCNEDTSVTHLVAPSIYGTWTIGSADGMVAYSTSPTKGEGYIKTLSMEHLENFPTATGASESTYWTSYFWNTSGATSGFRVCLRGASAINGGPCGLSTLDVYYAVSLAYVNCGAALCEAASEWSVEPVYYEAA